MEAGCCEGWKDCCLKSAECEGSAGFIKGLRPLQFAQAGTEFANLEETK